MVKYILKALTLSASLFLAGDALADSGCIADYIVYGATLGENWSGFPDSIPATYQPGSVDRLLDVTLPIYVRWIKTSLETIPGVPRGTATLLEPPQRLSDQVPAFRDSPGGQTLHGEYYVRAVGFGDDPLNSILHQNYAECPDAQALEQPRVTVPPDPPVRPLTSAGELRVRDVFGGIGNKTTIMLYRDVPNVPGCEGSPLLRVAVVIGWTQPGRQSDWYPNEHPVDASPGGLVTTLVWVEQGGAQVNPIYVPRRVVEWVSPDFVPASPRIVDAADLAGLASVLGKQVKYGNLGDPPFCTGSPPPPNCVAHYRFNCVMFGASALQIDAADLGLFAADLGSTCHVWWKTGQNEKDAILAWFGMAPTGRTVQVGPAATVPEINVVDWEQCLRAIANPYGYRDQPAALRAQPLDWSQVKRLYR